MRISGGYDYNGASYCFISLHGDFKWVYCELLKHMKKWNVRVGRIFVDDYWKYSVLVYARSILIIRVTNWHICSYSREG